jgi:hypothetical protein
MAMLLLLLIGAMPANGQKASPEPQRARARMENAVREMGADKRMKKMSEEQQWDMVEFVTGNMLFVALHELGHALVGQLRLPVLGREEDAADYFATLASWRPAQSSPSMCWSRRRVAGSSPTAATRSRATC